MSADFLVLLVRHGKAWAPSRHICKIQQASMQSSIKPTAPARAMTTTDMNVF